MATVQPPRPQVEEPTIGRLFADATRDMSTLVRGEIELAKAELKTSVRAGGQGAAFLGVAAVLGLVALILLSVAIAYFLVMAGLHPAWAFLIVFGAYLLLAGIFALVGQRKLKRVRPPERAIAEAQRTKEVLTSR